MYKQKHNMTQDEIFSRLSSEIEERQRDLDYFERAFDKCFYGDNDPTPDDLYQFTSVLKMGGGGHDEIGISLYRLAALAGHKKALKRYENTMGEKLEFPS
jgi:hypothetical protein